MAQTPRIVESVQVISARRSSEIQQLFSAMLPEKSTIIVNQTSAQKSIILGASNAYETGVDFTKWRFKTKKNSLYGMYYEIWQPYDKDIYFLDKLYFHLYKKNIENDDLEEYILLHCDVSESDEAEHALYKQSPHLHFHLTEYPLPKAHIALNNGNLLDVLSSLDSVHFAFQQALVMLNSQILVHFI